MRARVRPVLSLEGVCGSVVPTCDFDEDFEWILVGNNFIDKVLL